MSIEKGAHFVLNLIMITCVMPISCVFVLSLIPISVGFHWLRSHRTRELLLARLSAQRAYVSTLADIAENSAVIRGLGGAPRVRQAFAVDTRGFAEAHLAAVKFVVVTKERIELCQGLILAGIFFATGSLVNDGRISKGQAAGLIQAYLTGSADVVFLSDVMLNLKFCTEGLRMVSRILNLPTDAHHLSSSCDDTTRFFIKHMHLRPPASVGEAARAASPPRAAMPPAPPASARASGAAGGGGDGAVAGAEPHDESWASDAGAEEAARFEWMNTIMLRQTVLVDSGRKSLLGAHIHMNALARDAAGDGVADGDVRAGPAEEDAGRASPLTHNSRRESAVRRQEAVSHRCGTVV